MLDIKFIRENKEKVKRVAENKNVKVDIDLLLKLDEEKRNLMIRVQKLREERNKIAEVLQSSKGKDIKGVEKAKTIKKMLKDLEPELAETNEKLLELMLYVPNIPSNDTPIGKDEKDNVEVYKSLKKIEFDFLPKNHIDLAKNLDIIDFDRGVKVAGYRGYYLKNQGAQLAFAMMQYAFNKMIEKGYQMMIPPTMVKGFALLGSGYFKGTEYNQEIDEIYKVATSGKESSGKTSKDQKFLIGTAEPSLLAYYSGETLKKEDLPIKISGFSQCYRSEIGSYGKDTKGIYRVHEFMKVEQVIIAKADIVESDKLQKEMTDIAREIHEELGLPYRQIQICTGDMGLGKYKMFDIEAWLPGSNRWAETGSASNFLDWQSRRLNVKYLNKNGEKKYVYMLNNTVLPTPRPLIAILENYQQKDGSVKVPEVLQKYCGFEKITKA